VTDCTCAPLHLLQQVVHLAVNMFEVLVLAVIESDESLFDFVEALFVFVVHRDRYALVRDYNGVVIVFIGPFITSIEGKVVSIVRRVHKSLVHIPRGFGAWGVELAMFWWHFAMWGKPKCVKTLVSQRTSTKSM
jgi:hypothetical protein